MRTAELLVALLAVLAAGCGADPADGAGPGAAAGGGPSRMPGNGQAGTPGAGSGSSQRPDPGSVFEPWFADEAEQRGLRFHHVSGHGDAYLMPEIMAGGAALFDRDDDGWLDAYMVQSGALTGLAADDPPPNQLFANRGDGSFDDVTQGSGAGHTGYGMGVACGDVDNDGDVDLYVTNWGPNALMLNDGSGRFQDASAASGTDHPGWGTSAACVDVDQDGWLDLYVVNYLNWTVDGELSCRNSQGKRDYCNPANYDSPAMDVLYRNRGDGTFADITGPSGVGSAVGTGLGIGWGDFDDDGQTDIFVANDGMNDLLWKGAGAGRFTDVALISGCAVDHSGRAKAGMGVAVNDVDDDGDLDLLVCNLDRQSDSFFLNEDGFFSDRTSSAGLASVSRPFTRFGVGLYDFDHDGRLDLFEANGRVGLQTSQWAADPYAEPNLLLAGGDKGRFEALGTADGTAAPLAATSRGAAFGDIDNDGGVDVVVVNRDAPAQLLHNQAAGRDGHWIGFTLRDAAGGQALGATVMVESGARTVTRDVRVASSYLASNDPRVHVGLGAQSTPPGLSVRWPDGTLEDFGTRAIDRWHRLEQGQGQR